MFKIFSCISDICSPGSPPEAESTSKYIFRKEPCDLTTMYTKPAPHKPLRISDVRRSTMNSITGPDERAIIERLARPSESIAEVPERESIYEYKEGKVKENDLTFGWIEEKPYDTRILDVEYKDAEDMKNVLRSP